MFSIDTIPTAPTVFVIYICYFLTRYFCTPVLEKRYFCFLKTKHSLKEWRCKNNSFLFKSHITPYVLQIVLDYCRNFPSCGLGTPPPQNPVFICVLCKAIHYGNSQAAKIWEKNKKNEQTKTHHCRTKLSGQAYRTELLSIFELIHF